ncbi:MAG: DPP IV N-terminal domain-containing protein [Chitinophagaceae bacterium]
MGWKFKSFSQVIKNDSEHVIMLHRPESLEGEVFTSLERINQELKKINVEPLKSFPIINWDSQFECYFEHDNKIILLEQPDGASLSSKVLTELDKDIQNHTLHEKSKKSAYLLNNNLYVKLGANAVQITQDGSKDIVYGSSVHRNEFGIDGGLFWSTDGNALAFYRMDQSMVEDYPITDWNKTPAVVEYIKYPFAGRVSHHVTLGVYNLHTKHTVYLKTGLPEEQYLTTVTWSPDDKYVFVSLLNREQKHLKLNQYDATTGEFVKTLLEEKNERYVEPQHPLFFLNNNQFLWWSQRDGFMHLYHYDMSGKLLRQVTKGSWIVNELIAYNKQRNELIITSTKDSPLEKNIYKVNLSNNTMTLLSKTRGTHQALCNTQATYVIDQYSSEKHPRNIEIVQVDNAQERRFFTASNPLLDYDLATIKPVTLTSSDGQTLYGKLMLPSQFDEHKKYPTIVYLYNGPHVQLIKNSFPASGNLWYDYLTQHGYVVFVMDGRGSSNRGFAFESVIHRHLGTEEMKDQLLGVDYLKSLPFVDQDRMGVHGWSFGGFMTTSLMLRHNDVFKVGVAGGPVLDWSMYEIMYTERYMDTPQDNPNGYSENELISKVKDLKGKLLMIHGTNDDVVVWQHSLKFIQQAVKDQVQVDYFVYPGHPHNVRGKDRVHLMQKITDYFDMYLKP